jgi:hypothetical protein
MIDEGPIMVDSTGSLPFELQNHVNCKHNISPTPLLNARSSQHFELLDLPAEFRAVIYEMVLAISRIFFTLGSGGWYSSARFKERDLYHEPAQPLRACKLWHKVIEPVYLSKNIFVLPLEWRFYSPFE